MKIYAPTKQGTKEMFNDFNETIKYWRDGKSDRQLRQEGQEDKIHGFDDGEGPILDHNMPYKKRLEQRAGKCKHTEDELIEMCYERGIY